MKNLFVGLLVLAIFIYLAFSFALWEFNPGLWKPEYRFFAVYLLICFCWVPTVVNT